LHRIQLRQLVPGFAGNEAERDVLDDLAGRIDPADVQVWYQFALNGRRDLPLAPDVRSGFEMTLLRMLAFRGVEGSGDGGPAKRVSQPTHENPAPRRPATAAAASPAPRAETHAAEQSVPAQPRVAAPRIEGIADWERWIEQAELGGPAGLLARHAVPKSLEGDVLTLAVTPEHRIFCTDSANRQLQDRLGAAIERKLRVRIVHEAVAETPATRAAKVRSDEQAAAERSIADDPIIQDMQRQFGAQVIPESIRPAGRQV
jgi:DNA polymerase-3 subunit gamma/tau